MLANEFIRLPYQFMGLVPPWVARWGREHKDFVRTAYKRTISVMGPVQEMPVFDARVQVDPEGERPLGHSGGAAIRPQASAHLEIARFIAGKAEAWLKEAGAEQTWKRVPGTVLSGGQHQAGTCRMGNDPKTSVVDRNCQMHDVDNVYVIDASVHVTNGGFNPALTILANAYRASQSWCSRLERNSMKLYIVLLAATLLGAAATEQVSTTIDGKAITIHYAQPAAKKPVTASFHTDADLAFKGFHVPKGDYTVYVLTDAATWQLAVNKATGAKAAVYDAKLDVGRVNMVMAKGPAAATCKITLTKTAAVASKLEVAWNDAVASASFYLDRGLTTGSGRGRWKLGIRTAPKSGTQAKPPAPPVGRRQAKAASCAGRLVTVIAISFSAFGQSLLQQMTLDEKLSLVHGTRDPRDWVGRLLARLAASWVFHRCALRTDPGHQRQSRCDWHAGAGGLAATFDVEAARLYGVSWGAKRGPRTGRGARTARQHRARPAFPPQSHRALAKTRCLTAAIGGGRDPGHSEPGVMAQVKHFAGLQRGGECRSSTRRTLHEIYLPAFAAAVKAGVASVMCGYNKINGDWACENYALQNGVLRGVLGFSGFMTSDWGAVHSPQAILVGSTWRCPAGKSAAVAAPTLPTL